MTKSMRNYARKTDRIYGDQYALILKLARYRGRITSRDVARHGVPLPSARTALGKLARSGRLRLVAKRGHNEPGIYECVQQ